MKKILFILLIIYFIFLIRQDIINFRSLQQEEQLSIKNLKFEQEHKVLLEKRMKDLGAPGYVEELARTRLCLVKKGEIAYKVIDK